MLAKGGKSDFGADVALYFPLRVIMGILGVENEAENTMLRLTQEVFGASDPEANMTGLAYANIERRIGPSGSNQINTRDAENIGG